METKKRYKKGFALGKFLPLHMGHVFLIESAMEFVDEMTILVCTLEKEPIDGKLRFHWMKETFPTANVIHITDNVPSYPHEHEDFWNIWTALLRREIDTDTEVFFSSEDYGFEVAERLGISHHIIDEERKHVPISGTQIRENPIAHWEYIPACVQSHFVKRIVLVGPESTGKTFLSEKLAHHFNTQWVEEYGREYFVDRNGHLELSDMENIARGQLSKENNAVLAVNKLLFCDTDLIVTQIWSEIYFQECPQSVIDLSYKNQYDLYLLMDIDIPWEDDGTREFPNLRQWHFDRLKKELDSRGLKYVIISGNYQERTQRAIEAVNRLLIGVLF